MNIELLKQLRQRVAEVGNEGCDMAYWVGDGGVLLPDGDCGTTGCLAGHTIAIVTGSFTSFYDDDSLPSYIDGDGIFISRSVVGNVAGQYLGLTSSQALRLFHNNYWLAKYRLLQGDTQHPDGWFYGTSDNGSDAKAMLALLDDLLDGLLIWDEKSERYVLLSDLEEELALELEG